MPSVGNPCAMAKAAPATAMGAGLTLGVAAQVRQAPRKGRQSPPAAFQRTINQQAFGGEILEVKREDKRPWQVE